MRPEYDLRGGVRGKYYKEYAKGTNVVLLDPDVAAVFRDSESVNQALRVLIKAADQLDHATARKAEPA
jgi:cellobiose-specific phosphotransferase system component IIB